MLAQTFIEDRTVTVIVTAEPGTITSDLEIQGQGSARCAPGDLFVAATGERIALGRAIQDFGRQVEAAGLEESVTLDDVARVFGALFLGRIEEVVFETDAR